MSMSVFKAEWPGKLAVGSKEAAAILSISQRSLLRWRDEVGLSYCRVGSSVLYSIASLSEWLAKRMQAERSKRLETVKEVKRAYEV